MNDCVEWPGWKNDRGYGMVWVPEKKRSLFAHRIVVAAILGWDALDGKQVNHRCDNPSCVNIDHLYVGTQSENLLDAYRRGRKQPWSPTTRLTADDVLDIRWLAEAGASQRSIAAQYKISSPHVSQIVRRRKWKHVA